LDADDFALKTLYAKNIAAAAASKAAIPMTFFFMYNPPGSGVSSRYDLCI
jgi:hypothetical protein